MSKILNKVVILILSGVFVIFTVAFLYFFQLEGIGGIGFGRFLISLIPYLLGSAILIVFIISFNKKNRLEMLYGLRFELFILSLSLLVLSVVLLKNRVI